MIKADQPTIFDASVIAAVSSRTDGSMKVGPNKDPNAMPNRERFLRPFGITLEDTTFVPVNYNTEDFARYRIVTSKDKGGDMFGVSTLGFDADALIVTEPHHALFLTLGDCVAAIIHDPVHHVLMLSHLGRHSTEVDGGAKSIEYLKHHLKVDPKKLRVWLSPAVGSETYPLHKFEGKSLHKVLVSQLLRAGVERQNIEVCEVDTATSDDYFSHSEYLKGNTTDQGRFAVVAMMTQ